MLLDERRRVLMQQPRQHSVAFLVPERQLSDRQPVDRTGYRTEVMPANVQVNHRGGEALVTEQAADRQ